MLSTVTSVAFLIATFVIEFRYGPFIKYMYFFYMCLHFFIVIRLFTHLSVCLPLYDIKYTQFKVASYDNHNNFSIFCFYYISRSSTFDLESTCMYATRVSVLDYVFLLTSHSCPCPSLPPPVRPSLPPLILIILFVSFS